MIHQNLQKAIEQLSTGEDFRSALLSNSNEIKSRFNLDEDDMKAINSYNSSKSAVRPTPNLCCCCLNM
jgi:hypothetical protein